ncbi:hypothetical protein R6Q57_011764 [Mikania cordata]
MSFWDESFFNYSVPDLNEEPPVEYSYDIIDLNAERNADVGFDSQASYGSCMTIANKVTRRRVMKKIRRLQTLTGKPKRTRRAVLASTARLVHSKEEDDLWLGVLGDCGEAERARAILGEDTPWTRLFDLAELPTYRLLTVEFLSTFRYRAHQTAVRVEEDAELPPDIEFSLSGQHFEISIKQFAVHLGIYCEPNTVSDDFAHGLTQGEDGVMRAWWAQISDTPFTGHRVRATMIRDPLIRYIHRCIVTTISGRGQSQEWVTTTDLFYQNSLIAGRPSNLARCFRIVLRLLLPSTGARYTLG